MGFLVCKVKDILWHWGFSISLKQGFFLLFFFFFFFDDAINKAFSGQQTIQKSRKPVNYFIDCHHFAMGIAGPDKQLRAMSGSWDTWGEGIYFSSILTIDSFLGLFAFTQRVRKNNKDFPILTQPPNCRHLHIADTFVQTRSFPLFKGFTLTWKIYPICWIES